MRRRRLFFERDFFQRSLEVGSDSQGDSEGHEEAVALPETGPEQPAAEGVQGLVGQDDVPG